MRRGSAGDDNECSRTSALIRWVLVDREGATIGTLILLITQIVLVGVHFLESYKPL